MPTYLPTCLPTYIHTYIRIHTHTYAYIHRCIHTYIDTYMHTYIQTDRQTDRHTDIQTYRHTDVQTYRHTDILADPMSRKGYLRKQGTGPWRCVYTNPHKHTTSYTRPRASKENEQNTPTHLQGPEKLVRTYANKRKNGKTHDDETGGYQRSAGCRAKPSAWCYKVYCKDTLVRLKVHRQLEGSE